MDKSDKNQLRQERARLLKAREARKKALEKEPKVKVRFLNIEDPPGPGYEPPPVIFTVNGERYELQHDGEYELPVSLIKRLTERCKIPNYRRERDPETGEFRSVSVPGSYRHRFSFQPVGEEAYKMFENVNTVNESPRRKKPGPKPMNVEE